MSASGDVERTSERGGEEDKPDNEVGLEENATPPEPTPPLTTINLQSTMEKLNARVGRLLDTHPAGEPLPAWGLKATDNLAGLTSSIEVQNSDANVVQSENEKWSYAEILTRTKNVSLTQTDVNTRLSGSAAEIGSVNDVDAQSALNQLRTAAGCRAQSVRPNDQNFADNPALEYFSLISDGPVATRHQQLMSGCMNWQSTSPNADGKCAEPANWKELSNAVLVLLMPSNSVEECALRPASFKMEKRKLYHTALFDSSRCRHVS